MLAHRIWQYFSLHDRTIIVGAKYARAVNLMVAIPTGYYPTNWFWSLSKIIKFEVQNSLLRAIYSMVYSTVEYIRISSNLCFRTTILYPIWAGANQRHTSPFTCLSFNLVDPNQRIEHAPSSPGSILLHSQVRCVSQKQVLLMNSRQKFRLLILRVVSD